MSPSVIVGTGVVGTRFPDHDPAAILGKKGLRYKDEATRLAMSAAQLALWNAGIVDSSDMTTAVVVSSNYGNLDTVCRVAGDGSGPGERGPMDLPNASSNVVASSIAIRFGYFGPNLMVCSGATSGLDAVIWAHRLLEAGRAARVLVVGVEVDNAVVSQFATAREPSGLFHGAACVVLERAGLSDSVPRAVFGGCARGGAIADLLATGQVNQWYVPDFGPVTALADVTAGAEVIDIASRVGAASGALGVLQAASAAAAPGASLLTVGGGADPLAACLITPISLTNSGELS